MMALTCTSARTFAIALSLFLLPTAVRAEIAIQAYALPSGCGPHDVAPSPEAVGSVWYTAQRQGALGRLNPATGAVEQIPLGSGSAPHGVIVGPDGAPWVTDSGLNAIVRVDPGTREARVFRLPAQRSDVNLNTAAFDRRGKLWFTGQNGVYGRLDPETGEMRVWDAPQGRGPYGITATPTAPSTTPPSPATTSPAPMGKPAGPRASSPRPRNRARAGSGPTLRGASGSASGLPARSASTTRKRRRGARGACRESGRRRLPSMSTRRTVSG